MCGQFFTIKMTQICLGGYLKLNNKIILEGYASIHDQQQNTESFAYA